MRLMQRGIGLVEVLVALLLLAIAVLGFTAMQMRAVKATDESLIRTRALTIMRGGAEMMRANPDGIASFKTALNATALSITVDNSTITKDSCMSNTSTAPTICTINQLATKDALNLKQYATDNELNLALVTCPGTGTTTSGTTTISGQERQCFVASWGSTNTSLSNNGNNNCANADGIYNSNAQCFILEAY